MRSDGMFLLCVALYGCGANEVPETVCVQNLSTSCSPLFEPSYTNVFEQTLTRSCGVSGAACHASEGAQAGLILDDADEAYTQLLEPAGAEPRVKPGDPECSPLVVRLEAGGAEGMPPGSPLSAEERCSIIAWIRDGAAR